MRAMAGFEKLYWSRFGFGILGGYAAEKVFGTDLLNGISLMILFYLFTFYIARYGLYRKVAKENVTKLYTTGIGTYVIVFLWFWVLFFTAAQL